MSKEPNLANIIKAYDIRGLVGEEITPEFTFQVGASFAKLLIEKNEPKTVVVGEDMRPSSKPLADSFSQGVRSLGLSVIRIGLASTDMLYFASGDLNLPGAMFTASHNPAKYNGIKLCYSKARPVGRDTGLKEIEETIKNNSFPAVATPGEERTEGMLENYAKFLINLFPEFDSAENKLRKLRVAVDAGNGMAGYTAPAIFAKTPFEIIPLYFELDGNFPNHEANPIEPSNLRDLQQAVRDNNCDLGLAFDGDADRCFLVDEKGELITPSALTALIAQAELVKHPGAKIIYNLISSKVVPEIINEHGGVAIRSRVGHSFIKALMAEHNAVFGGEHSGHFYFSNFWRADSGALAALYALVALASSKESASELFRPFNRYFLSGEINIAINPEVGVAPYLAKAKYHFANQATFDELDGLTVQLPNGWFNLRPSNTEPLLRLNVEGYEHADLTAIKGEVLQLLQ